MLKLHSESEKFIKEEAIKDAYLSVVRPAYKDMRDVSLDNQIDYSHLYTWPQAKQDVAQICPNFMFFKSIATAAKQPIKLRQERNVHKKKFENERDKIRTATKNMVLPIFRNALRNKRGMPLADATDVPVFEDFDNLMSPAKVDPPVRSRSRSRSRGRSATKKQSSGTRSRSRSRSKSNSTRKRKSKSVSPPVPAPVEFKRPEFEWTEWD